MSDELRPCPTCGLDNRVVNEWLRRDDSALAAEKSARVGQALAELEKNWRESEGQRRVSEANELDYGARLKNANARIADLSARLEEARVIAEELSMTHDGCVISSVSYSSHTRQCAQSKALIARLGSPSPERTKLSYLEVVKRAPRIDADDVVQDGPPVAAQEDLRTDGSTSGKEEPASSARNRPACSPTASDSAPDSPTVAALKEQFIEAANAALTDCANWFSRASEKHVLPNRSEECMTLIMQAERARAALAAAQAQEKP